AASSKPPSLNRGTGNDLEHQSSPYRRPGGPGNRPQGAQRSVAADPRRPGPSSGAGEGDPRARHGRGEGTRRGVRRATGGTPMTTSTTPTMPPGGWARFERALQLASVADRKHLREVATALDATAVS